MKKVHLICNAHLDPIWQWEWEEGAAAALSTFRCAADLADEFDYIFCHNEVTLYQYVEEYAPALFAQIRELVRMGKWHIMGGWYLQPDCNMPLGESFVRQILTGRRYFMEKFGQWSTTAINFDPFGHTRGLAQIIRKCGQDSYLIYRPGRDPIPGEQFVWEGFDGSWVKVDAAREGYNTPLGDAVKAIRKRADRKKEDVICILWGVGNHGGGPSRKDLAEIGEFMKEGIGQAEEMEENSTKEDCMEIIHSTPENFFAEIHPEKVHNKSLRISMPGCYTSMSLIKRKHAELENTLYMTEKLCSVAAMRGLIKYPQAELQGVTEDLLNCEFHDVLPGSCIRAGEENGLRLIDHGLLRLNRLRARAYFALTAMEPKAAEGEYPVLVWNPNPYTWETEVVCELSLADQNRSDTMVNYAMVLDENGSIIPSQTVKEESNLNLDWRKRIVFRAELKPLSLTRFSVYMNQDAKREKKHVSGKDVVLDLPKLGKHVEIDGRTGLLRSYRIQGREYIAQKSKGAFCPVFYKDNPDPWGMGGFQLGGLGSDPTAFELMEHPDGPFTGMQPIQVIEDGEIYLSVECFFRCENTRIRIEYDIYKNDPAVDVKVDVFMNDTDRMLKLAVPVNVQGEYIGQTAFGTESLYMDGRECVAQRFVALREGNKEHVDRLALFNRGTYGSSWKDGVLSMSLLRSVTYCAHPVGERPIIPDDRYTKKMDMGERNFIFRLTVAPEKALERLAAEFNMPPYACNVFPIETDVCATEFSLTISDSDIVLVAMKKSVEQNGYVMRLLNNYGEECRAVVNCCGAEIALAFGKYEVKTVLYDGNKLTEVSELII